MPQQGMDMDSFNEAYKRSQENSGVTFGEIEKLLVRNGLIVRLIGTYAVAWEHFLQTAKGSRPVYCVGPNVDDGCRACALIAQWGMSDDPNLQDQAKDQRAREKFYFNVLDRSAEGAKWHQENKRSKLLVQNDKGMNIGPQLLQAIGAISQMRKDQGKPNDPNMYDIAFQKTGTKMSTKYGALPTGDEEPLTEEELGYELYDLSQLTQHTSQVDVDAIITYLTSSPSERSEQSSKSVSFNPQEMQAQAQAQAAPAAAPVAAPAAAVAPVAQAVAAPVAAPEAASPPPDATVYADTSPTDDYDPKSHYQVPCGECGKQMQISLTDHTDLKCHGCDKIYQHPSKV